MKTYNRFKKAFWIITVALTILEVSSTLSTGTIKPTELIGFIIYCTFSAMISTWLILWVVGYFNPTEADLAARQARHEAKQEQKQQIKLVAQEQKVQHKNQQKAHRQHQKNFQRYQQEQREIKLAAVRNVPHCPNCLSTQIQPLAQHRKGFSVGKAVGGAVLTGGIGTLAGFAGKNTKKVDWVCLKCGNSFTM